MHFLKATEKNNVEPGLCNLSKSAVRFLLVVGLVSNIIIVIICIYTFISNSFQFWNSQSVVKAKTEQQRELKHKEETHFSLPV